MSEDNKKINYKELAEKAIAQPLVKHIYTADPSAHVLTEKFTFIHRMILMLEKHLTIWEVISTWKIIMYFLWIT